MTFLMCTLGEGVKQEALTSIGQTQEIRALTFGNSLAAVLLLIGYVPVKTLVFALNLEVFPHPPALCDRVEFNIVLYVYRSMQLLKLSNDLVILITSMFQV